MNVKILFAVLLVALLLFSGCTKVVETNEEVAPEELSDEQLTEEVEETVDEGLIAEDDYVEIGEMI